MKSEEKISELSIPLERDEFTRTLLGDLSGLLQDVVGLDEASGFISMVGQKMGERIYSLYCEALGVEELSREQMAEVLVDLKRRIQGDFYVISHDDERIVMGNRACPFAEKVVGRPALCMMTSNVFGSIAAKSQGYAKVAIEEAIANGNDQCRVVVYLKKNDEAEQAEGREYYRAD